jgi:hypothetical protein
MPPTYPISADVIASQPTAYQHYNNLRADALRFGAASPDAINLGAGLARYADNITLQPLATNRLRLPYNALQPPTLMIDGYLCQSTADVDLSPGTFTGVAATWYIFANRTPGSTTFTLSANTSLTEASGQRRIASVDWDGSNLKFATLFVNTQGRPGVYYAKASRAAPQSIGNAAWTTISFDTEDADTDNMYAAGAPTRITIVHPGLYLVAANCVLAANATGERGYGLLLNNTTYLAYILNAGNAAPNNAVNAANLAALAYLSVGDYLELKTYQASGGPLNASGIITMTVAALSA